MNWHTKSQGPKKKCTHFTRERIDSCSMDTAHNKGSFTSIALWSVQSFLSNPKLDRVFAISKIVNKAIPEVTRFVLFENVAPME